MSDQPEQNEVDKTIRTKEGSQGTTQALKDLASVILSKTNTYTPEEVNYLAHSQEFGKKVDKVQNIAHKSGGGEAPEGTILAMEKALENGADWLDIDLRITKGKSDSEIGTIIISHSPRAEDIDPSSDVKGTIPELTLEQIKKLDAGHNFTKDYKNFPYRGEGLDIPTVEEALAKFPNIRFTMHLLGANEGIEDELVRVIEKYNAYDRVFIAGFSEEPLIKVKELSGGRIKRSAGARETIEFMAAVKRGETPSSVDFDFFTPGGEEAQSRILYEEYGAKLMEIARQKKLPDIDYIVACKKLGVPVYIWNVNDSEEMMLLVALGVEGIYTDYPSRLNELKLQYKGGKADVYIIDGVNKKLIAGVAAKRLDWENRMPTPDDIVAEVREMEFFLSSIDR